MMKKNLSHKEIKKSNNTDIPPINKNQKKVPNSFFQKIISLLKKEELI